MTTNFQKRIMLRDRKGNPFWITVMLTVHEDKLMDRLGARAWSNKSRYARYLHGAVEVQVTSAEANQDKVQS